MNLQQPNDFDYLNQKRCKQIQINTGADDGRAILILRNVFFDGRSREQ